MILDALLYAVSHPFTTLWMLVAVGLLVAIASLVMPLIRAGRSQRTPDYPDEMYYPDADGAQKLRFPRIEEEPSRLVSLIVPAYNEEKRLSVMLEDMMGFLQEKQRQDASFTWEFIVVDDGSKDRTCEVVRQWSNKYGSDKIRLLKLRHNLGKGGAVRKGMMRARGQYLLMVDADGATVGAELDALLTNLRATERNGHGIAVGSRAHLQDEAVAQRKWYRNVLMHGFHGLVYLLCGGHGVRDTQCGFKLFTRRTARILFATQHIERWAFDVELLFLAARLRIPIVEVAVRWTEIDGSHLSVFASTFQMLRDLVLIRLCYLLSLWHVEGPRDGLPSASGIWKKRHQRAD